jgi:hypothetical protein
VIDAQFCDVSYQGFFKKSVSGRFAPELRQMRMTTFGGGSDLNALSRISPRADKPFGNYAGEIYQPFCAMD